MCSAPEHIQNFGTYADIISALVRVPRTSMFVTATTDGSVTVWSLDAPAAKFKMRCGAGVAGLSFTSDSSLVFYNAASVYAMTLQHFSTAFAACSSEPVSVEAVAPGVVMAVCAVRIATPSARQSQR